MEKTWQNKLEFVGEVYTLLEEAGVPGGDFTRFDIIGYALKVPPAFIPEETDRAAKMFAEWMYSCEEMPQEPMLPDWFDLEKHGY